MIESIKMFLLSAWVYMFNNIHIVASVLAVLMLVLQ